jgi:hypothetical protein
MEATVEPISTLTDEERQVFFQCERAVKAANESFYAGGSALRTIRDRHLHRETHATFDAYCVAEFDISRSRACRLIGAADVIDHLRMLPIGNILPATESQVRPLLVFSTRVGRERVLDFEKMDKVWADVVAQAQLGPDGAMWITAKLVRDVADRWRRTDQRIRDDGHRIQSARRVLKRAFSKVAGDLPNTMATRKAIATLLHKLAGQLKRA